MPRLEFFSLDEIARALQDAGTDYDQRAKIGRALFAIIVEKETTGQHEGAIAVLPGRRIGRPPEDDDIELREVARLVRYEGKNPNAAASLVTAALPPSKRKTAQRRIYKKFKKDSAYWLSEAQESPIEQAIRRLRQELGDHGAGAVDYRDLLRHFLAQKKPDSSG